MFVDVPDAAGNTQVNMINSTFEYLEKNNVIKLLLLVVKVRSFFHHPDGLDYVSVQPQAWINRDCCISEGICCGN